MLGDLETIFVTGLTTGAIYASIAFALTLTYNVSGVVNLAQGEFYMLSPFIALVFINELGWSLLPAILVTLVVVTLIAGALYSITIAPLRHANEDNIILLTFGLIFVISGAVLIFFGAASRSFPSFVGLETIGVAGITISRQGIWVIVVTALVLVGMWLALTKTVPGIAMRAAADNPFAARAIGLRPRHLALLAFCLGGFLGGLTGLLAAPLAFVHFGSGLAALAGGAIAAIIGGWGNYGGALLGALIYGFTEAAAATYLPTTYGTAFTVAAMIIILILRPQGLLPGRYYRVRSV